MIIDFKNFKLFESRDYSKKELIDQLDDNDVEYFYERNHSMDADEIISNWPDTIWDHIDDQRYINDFIKDYADGMSLEDFSDYDYKKYIKDNLSKGKETSILDIYKENYYDEDEEDFDELEFDDYMIDELSDDELRQVIEEDNQEYDFIENVVRGWYQGQTAKDIFQEFNGYKSFEDIDKAHQYSYNVKPHEIKEKILSNLKKYINEDSLEKSYINDTDFYTKKEEIEEDIEHDKKLQRKLLQIDKENVLKLIDIFDKSYNNSNIGNEYNFQKAYIEQYLSDYIDGDDDNYSEEERSDIRAKSLKLLHDKFGLDDNIEKEYQNDMWLVHSAKYNI